MGNSRRILAVLCFIALCFATPSLSAGPNNGPAGGGSGNPLQSLQSQIDALNVRVESIQPIPGPQGPPGPAGPQGPQGPAGPAGATGATKMLQDKDFKIDEGLWFTCSQP